MKLSNAFIKDVHDLIHTARASVVRGVNLIQVHTNFEIGRRIFEQEQKGRDRAAYGQEVIRTLAGSLTTAFGKGYSKRNLELFRKFYLSYVDRKDRIAQSPIAQSAKPPKSQSLTARSIPQSPFRLSWTHYVFLLGIKDSDERSFYEIESAEANWTVRELKRQFDSSLYQRLALSRDKKGIRKLAKEGQIVAQPADLLKEPLVLEFLGLHESHRYSENDLENAIIDRLEHFLLEMGKGFLFEARQRRFTLDGDHYFVDLVFYNRLLRCYVLIDLKIGRLTHQDLGQMQMYVNTYDREAKLPEENPTVGIILCKQKSKTLVEITLPKGANIHAHEYQLYLPSKAELERKLNQWVLEAKD